MTGALGIVTLAMADSINPLAIGMVLEALIVNRAIRQATVFAAATLIINTVFAWLLIQGFDFFRGLQQTIWPVVLIVLAGVGLVGQGLYDAAKAYRHPDVRIRLWLSIADATSAKTIVVAAAVSLALLPFGGQLVVAMLEISGMHGSAVFDWGWAVLYSTIYTLPLWVIIGFGLTPLGNWRSRSEGFRRYGAAVASMVFGLILIVIGLFS
ncbi:hypothetical protein [Acetobacter oeni]|uniref:Uncharacterized protein n=1 Tax=Acetobacter oeni TaxID=304077 RepID=A0A511XR40_9PROT|nr:hypothetical protein [Acetobacter oeni]MBB3883734.1 isoprenylcysteine carboxyl methyltransferase (ICMT) family protein YpbQ [Acetobacter oeni]NHO20853.1 hypothetical protein [Acetobacter oeni]GBR10233.1 hypothetical protein AA21952_3015 [Acetobacter oeni LMG 21952]GEN65369.1 hypothetical protein AOE01nite_35930 [Acetobacter oeni]